MATEHSDVAAELWALAETVLTRLEPILARAVEDQADAPRQGCSWCPVCALAALIRGEQHDLLTLVATEGATVVAMIRQIVSEHSATGAHRRGDDPTTPNPGSDAGFRESDHTSESPIAHDTEVPGVRRAGFTPITVNVKNSGSGDRGEDRDI
ncbi:hypothetical protein [Rhodococcoides kyotonense]|uniref:Uncharacterized protein n=1 Tax=Rhodococcoides kyotonense TaxID=398843 RepID=A0A239KY04_9NOCA|nr:hypothetical protein [Rhodococcus kyotonensis]SNT22632.1 hypothetical protein SAMN05421642_111166 [Rhodococcus kyotonensis]